MGSGSGRKARTDGPEGMWVCIEGGEGGGGEKEGVLI